MSRKETHKTNNPKPDDKAQGRSTGESARRILLAGIGAYGRAFMEAQEALKDVRGKSSDVFDDLVQKGEMMEMAFEHKSKQVMDKAASNIPKLDIPNLKVSGLNMDDRIKKMRARLIRNPDEDSDILARLEIVEAKLDTLMAALEPKKAQKNAGVKKALKKSTTKKTTAKTTRTPKKRAAKKSTAKKPASKT